MYLKEETIGLLGSTDTLEVRSVSSGFVVVPRSPLSVF